MGQASMRKWERRARRTFAGWYTGEDLRFRALSLRREERKRRKHPVRRWWAPSQWTADRPPGWSVSGHGLRCGPLLKSERHG